MERLCTELGSKSLTIMTLHAQGQKASRLVGSGCIGPIPLARRLNSLHLHAGAPCAETIRFCRD